MSGSHLIFDLDGTLTDPREGITRCFLHVLERLQLPLRPQRELERFIGPPLRDALAELIGTRDAEQVEQATTLYRERFATTGLFENFPYPGIHEALAELRERGHSLWVCTSKAGVYAKRILVHFELSTFFREVYGCELDGALSDKAELLAHILERHAIEPARAIMIGDRKHDIRAAKLNGLRSVGVLYGFGDEAELREAGTDSLCGRIADLGSVIARFDEGPLSVRAVP
jgi:phosphoglycolate phosphatase